MPTRPRTICPDCKRSWDGVRCECGHAKRAWGWQDDKERGTRQQRGYTEEWFRLQREKLTQEPWCARCQRQGRAERATTAHHLRDGPGGDKIVPLEWLEALCRRCHDEVSREESVRARKR